MDRDSGTTPNPDWRDANMYKSMLAFDRRAWASQWLSRDQDFAAVAASVAPTSSYICRADPPITVISLFEEDRLAPWGLHFRARAGPVYRGRLCRMAC